MRPVPGEIASVQVHLRTSVANSQLNNDAIHNYQVSRHGETYRRGRDLLQEKKKKQMQEMKSIHLAKLQQRCGTM